MERFIHIINWSRFQHYKHRNPPWIKLHRELLSSRTWVTANDASRTLAVTLMLLAGEHENMIPLDTKYITRVGYLNKEPDLQPLLDSHFIEIVDSASKPLAPCKQDASTLHQNADPELEEEKESEEENRKTICSEPTSSASEPDVRKSVIVDMICLPCVGELKTYYVTALQMNTWKEDFPGVDIEAEVRHMRAWLDANPTKRKTARGIRRFAVNWLSRAQDRNHPSNGVNNGKQTRSNADERLARIKAKTAAAGAGFALGGAAIGNPGDDGREHRALEGEVDPVRS